MSKFEMLILVIQAGQGLLIARLCVRHNEDIGKMYRMITSMSNKWAVMYLEFEKFLKQRGKDE